MQARPGGQSHHLFLEQELVIRAGSLHFVQRDAFSLRVGGSENVYTEGGEEQGLRAVSESTAWTFATFPRIREVLKLKCLLAEYQRLVTPPQQLCRRILQYLLFN